MRLGPVGGGIPGTAASLDDGLGVGEETQRQEALAQIGSDPLDWVEFRAIGRQRQQGEVFGDIQRTFVVPAGTVEDQDSVGAGWQRDSKRPPPAVSSRRYDGALQTKARPPWGRPDLLSGLALL